MDHADALREAANFAVDSVAKGAPSIVMVAFFPDGTIATRVARGDAETIGLAHGRELVTVTREALAEAATALERIRTAAIVETTAAAPLEGILAEPPNGELETPAPPKRPRRKRPTA